MLTNRIIAVFSASLIYILLTIFPSVFVVASSPLLSLKNFSQAVLPADEHYKIELVAPKIAENGAEVGIRVNVLKVPVSDSVKNVKLFICQTGNNRVFEFKPLVPTYNFRTRIKIPGSRVVLVVVKFSSGKVMFSEKLVKVIYGSMGGGSSSSSLESNIATAPLAKTWVRSSLPENSTRIRLVNGHLLPIRSYRADVKITGFRARVLLDIEFSNPFRRSEATFQLRLPDNASPYYVAFGDQVYKNDIDAKHSAIGKNAGFDSKTLGLKRILKSRLKEAVMVESKKAEAAYESTVQRNIDPALVKWNGSGVYTVKLFPVLTNGLHRVVIAYDMDIGQRFEYVAPLVDVPVRLNIHFDDQSRKWLSGYIAHQVNDDNVLSKVLKGGERVQISQKKSGNYLLTSQQKNTGSYFATQLDLQLNKGFRSRVNSNAVFMLDSSAGTDRNILQNRIELIDAILKRNQDNIYYFNVLVFDVVQHWWRKELIANTPENRKILVKQLLQIRRAGATDIYSALKAVAKPSWSRESKKNVNWDVYLLSDGRMTWGERNLKRIIQAANSERIEKLFVYLNNRDQRVINRWRTIVNVFNGNVFSFLNEAKMSIYTIDPLPEAHRYISWRLKAITAKGAKNIVSRNQLSRVYSGQQLTLIGQGKPVGFFYFHLQSGSKTKILRLRVPGKSYPSDLVPRLFGEVVVNILEDRGFTDLSVIRAYASHFRIARKTMTLLMLESKQGYKRHNIVFNKNYQKIIKYYGVADAISHLKIKSDGRVKMAKYKRPTKLFDKIINLLGKKSTCNSIKTIYLQNLDPIIIKIERKRREMIAANFNDMSQVLPKIRLSNSYFPRYKTIEKFETESKKYGRVAAFRLLTSSINFQALALKDNMILIDILAKLGFHDMMINRYFYTNKLLAKNINSLSSAGHNEHIYKQLRLLKAKQDNLINSLIGKIQKIE